MKTDATDNTGKQEGDALSKMQGRIAVLMGGNTSEREVSLTSGAAVVDALKRLGADVIAIDTAADVLDTLQTVRPDFAFLALHGRGGEDGTMQALLEMLAIPYSGSGVLGSALAMDKVRAKNVWRGIGLPTPHYEVLASGSDFAAVLDRLGGKVFVKPAQEGSSVGLAMATTAAELEQAFNSAAQYDTSVFAEQFIEGPEYTVSLLEGYDLPSIRISTERAFYNYEAKYQDDDTRFFIPSGLSEQEELALKQCAQQAFDALGCRGWGRIDFMRDASTNAFYLLEANTIPGLTTHSLVPMAASAVGIDFDHLIANIINIAMRVHV